jgi:L-2-hydroxyglutarate oxidase LhgO
VEPADIDPESAGVISRRYPKGEKFRDFVIHHEADKGLPGFINVLGIESPGLTASPAIAKVVNRMVEEILH